MDKTRDSINAMIRYVYLCNYLILIDYQNIEGLPFSENDRLKSRDLNRVTNSIFE